jgi:hypothetical protein
MAYAKSEQTILLMARYSRILVVNFSRSKKNNSFFLWDAIEKLL